jgi:hypothetical protein
LIGKRRLRRFFGHQGLDAHRRELPQQPSTSWEGWRKDFRGLRNT